MASNLFDVERYGSSFATCTKPGPRAATGAEVHYYLEGLARGAGLIVFAEAKLIGGNMCARGMRFGERFAKAVCETPSHDNEWSRAETTPPQYEEGAYCVPMPGYGQVQRVTVDLLDDAGDVVRTIQLPADRKGALAFTAKDAEKWSGIAPAKRRKAAVQQSKPVSAPVAATAPAEELPGPFWRDAMDVALAEVRAELASVRDQLAARPVAATPAARTVPAPANDDRGEKRTPAQARAIMRAWRMRGDMRAARQRHASEVAAMAEHREAARKEAHEAWAQFIAMEAQRDLAKAQVLTIDRLAEERLRSIAAQDRNVHRLNLSLRAAEARGDRLARIASNSRKEAQRAADDLRGSRAEARALGRRLSGLQDAMAASPAATAVLNRHLEAAEQVSTPTATRVSRGKVAA